QDADAPHRPADVQSADIIDHGDAGRVIPAVLQPLEALDEQRLGDLLPDVSDDPAHVPFPPVPLARATRPARNIAPPPPTRRPAARITPHAITYRTPASCGGRNRPDNRSRCK